MNIKGYLFDYGGTLDTGGCHWGLHIWHAYEREHIAISQEQFRKAYIAVERMIGVPGIIKPQDTFKQTLQKKIRMQLYYLSLPQTLLTPLVDSLYSQTVEQTQTSYDILKLLPQPKVLVSNFYGNLKTVLAEFGLTSLFCHVVESAVVGVRKPSPQMFMLGTEALQMSAADVAVVGDSIRNDILPAQQLGCKTIWLRGGEPWDEHPDAELIPDVTIDHLAALATV